MCCMQSRCARLPRAHAHRLGTRSRSIAGYFQSEEGRFSCIHCDSLGDYYQELPAQSGCRVCPQHTQRFVGALDASNRSSCQCKAGLHRAPFTASVHTSLPSAYTTASLHRCLRVALLGRILQLRGSRRGLSVTSRRYAQSALESAVI